MAKIDVQGKEIKILSSENEDYISLTDMVRAIENGLSLIKKWLRNKNTIEFLGIWEEIYNPNFNFPYHTIMRSIYIETLQSYLGLLKILSFLRILIGRKYNTSLSCVTQSEERAAGNAAVNTRSLLFISNSRPRILLASILIFL